MTVMGVPIEDYELGLLELQKSPVYQKIPQEMRKTYVEQSLMIGDQYAQQYRSVCISDVVKENHIDILHGHVKKKRVAVMLRAEINFSNRSTSTIKIYDDSVRSIATQCNPVLPESYQLTDQQIYDVHLAHEFFHYLEFTSNKTVSSMLPKVHLGKLLNWERTSEVLQCSEVAANAFAKVVAHTQVLPDFYDFVYVKTQDSN